MEELLGKTNSGEEIFMDDDAKEHVWGAHPDMNIEHIKEALKKVEFTRSADGSFCKTAVSIDLGRIIGKSGITEITDENKNEIVKVYRTDRKNTSNVLIGKEGDETSKIFIVVGYIPQANKSFLFTAAYGEDAPKEPNDPSIKDEEKEEAEEFFSKYVICCPNAKEQIDWDKTSKILNLDDKIKYSQYLEENEEIVGEPSAQNQDDIML